jgi:predicted DNA-binding transcriptional regulator AlpA
MMTTENLDKKYQKSIMTLQEVSQFLQKSESWVYKHWKELGGKKLGGSLFFPEKENLYEHLFGRREGVEVRLHPQGEPADRSLVQNKTRGKKSRSGKKGGISQSETVASDTNRHGLLGVG